MKYTSFITLALAMAVSARPFRRQNDFTLKNGQDAIALNESFKNLKEGDACQVGSDACVGDRFAQCVGGVLVSQACAPGTQCAALPLVNAPGTSITCTTAADLAARIEATGAQGAAPAPVPEAPPANDGINNAGNDAPTNDQDPETSRTLLDSVICTECANDGQDGEPEPGQVPSLTSTNNFINFCSTVGNLPITNGQQIESGSCNPVPIGAIPSTDRMPSSKFQFPLNGDTVPANQAFTIRMQIKNLVTGNFVNAKKSYFAAPQQLVNGVIKGHSHVVVETMVDGMQQTEATNPRQFAFFKGLNGADQGGVLTAEVTKGLPPATYRLCSINTSANHAPAIVPVAQHGSLDDCIYFTTA